MALVDEAIRTYLLSANPVLALVGSRVYPSFLAQGSSFPAITVTEIDCVPAQTLAMASGLFSARFQFDCYAKRVLDAKILAKTVRQALDGLKGVFSGVSVNAVIFSNQFDTYEPDTELFRVSQDFNILFNE